MIKDLDSFLFNDQEESFNQENREIFPDANFQGKSRIQFNPKVVYQKCFEEKQLGEKYHLTFKFVQNETKLVRKILQGHGFEQVHSSSTLFNLMWTAAPIKPLVFKSLYPFQRVNHFPKSSELTRKDRLYKNIQKIQEEKGFKHFHFLPKTFILPYQYQQLKCIFEKEKGFWIVKPIASSQGRGIFLIHHPDQIPKDEHLIVSRYIANPLLIDGYKFDIRLYVAVTSYHPLVIYLYQEGLVRFATVKYDRSVENLSNCFMHLTNYSLNKRNDKYIRCDDPDIEDFGNKWTMSAMLRLLKSEGKDTFCLMMSIEDLIIKTLLSVQSPISNACQTFLSNKSNCFEVYGFDILVDDQLKAWLLEVNLSPSLTCDAPIDLKIKSQMICDLLNLTLLPSFDIFKYLNQQKETNANQKCSEKSNNEENIGMTFEDMGIIKKLEEENVASGGFIRIFPREETLRFFSNYFSEDKISLNKAIHQHLYPSQWQTSSFNCQENVKSIRSIPISCSKFLSSAFHLFNKTQINSSYLIHAIQRYQSYHQRFIHNFSSNKTNLNHSHKIVIGKSTIEVVDQEKFSSFLSSSSNALFISPQIGITMPVNTHRRLLSANSHLRNHHKNFNENGKRRARLRVSSAPKGQYRKKFNQISDVEQCSKSISTITQHQNRMSRRMSSSSKKFSNDEDIVEEINEISTKQHRRQYSCINHFPIQSFIISPPLNLHEEEKENGMKIKQFQRSEIYSALNRYSNN